MKHRAFREHLVGPWIATLADRSGHLYDSIDDVELEDGAEISVVRGTAAPTERDGGLRLPGTYASRDVLYSLDDLAFDDYDELRSAWEMAQGVAAALNSYANETVGDM